MAALLDVCRFVPTAGGTTDWTYSSAVTGYQSPTAAGAVNGRVYKYRAESASLSQWEVGEGAYNSGTGTFTRTTVLYNSSGTTAKINFTVAPQVAIVALKSDLLSIEEANAFTATQRAQARMNINAVLAGHIFGLTMSTPGSSANMSVAAGEAADSTASDLMVLASSITKTTGSWAVGTATGGLDTGTIAATTWYHWFLIKRPDTGVVDVLFSLSATSPTLPTNYTLFRRIGSMKTNGSSQWTQFTQIDDEFLLATPQRDVNLQNIGTTATTFGLASVPTGIVVKAIVNCWAFVSASNATAWFYPLFVLDQTVNYGQFANVRETTTTGSGAVSPALIWTNTSAQIRARGNTAGTTVDVATNGWVDSRGRLA